MALAHSVVAAASALRGGLAAAEGALHLLDPLQGRAAGRESPKLLQRGVSARCRFPLQPLTSMQTTGCAQAC